MKVCPISSVGTKYLPVGSALTRAINSGKAGFLGMNLGLAPMAALRAAGSFPGSLVHVLPYFLLILLMVGTTWYQQKQIQAVSTGQQAQQMQMMGKIMPLVLGVFSLNLPAGVSIYWVASNIWTISRWSESRGVYDDVCYLRQAHLFKQFGLDGTFTIVETGSPAGVVKAEAIGRIVAAWRVLAREVIYVGDAVSDMQAAHEAGVLPVAAAWAPGVAAADLQATCPHALFTDAGAFHAWLAG